MTTALFGLPINGLDNFEADRAPQDWNGFPVPLVAHDIALQIAAAVGDAAPEPYEGLRPYDGVCWQIGLDLPEVPLAILDALAAVGLKASFEYPGWICVEVPEGTWCFGTVNGVWDGDLMTADGTEHILSVRLDIDGGSGDAAMIALAIHRAIRGDYPRTEVARA